jgi:4-hydroxy-tetrahydrodipicolinate synthase
MALPWTREGLGGIWSALPTPLTETLDVDTDSVKRLVDHHVRLGVNGLLVAGTRGEGACLTATQRRLLLGSVVEANAGRMLVAMQVTENSEPRVLDLSAEAQELGADLVMLASPYFFPRSTARRLRTFFLTCLRESPLPVGLYDRGTRGGALPLPLPALIELCQEENVVMYKDSSRDKARRAMALVARRLRPELSLLSGDEFTLLEYLRVGYDGFLLGGASLVGYLAGQVLAAWRDEEVERAGQLDQRLQELLRRVYGGPGHPCWLSGDKALLQRMGLLTSAASFWEFPLTERCQEDLAQVLAKNREILLP